MSVESVGAALQVQGLTASEKLVLVGIANHDGDGGAWPKVSTLATYLGASERTTQRMISKLEQRGLVTVDRNAGGTTRTRGDRRPNLYHLHLDGVTQDVTPSAPRGDKNSPIDPSRGDRALSPEPSLEPSIEENHPLAVASAPAVEVVKPRPRNEMWDALEAVFGPASTKTAQGLRGRVIRELKEAGAEPHEVAERAGEYRRRMPKATLSETALVKWWGSLGVPQSQAARVNGNPAPGMNRLRQLMERTREA